MWPLALIAGGCVTPAPAGAWPCDVPPRRHFQAAYADDAVNAARQTEDRYLAFVVEFFRGAGLVPGWNAVERSLVRNAPIGRCAVVGAKLAHLARLAAGEWAKDNAVRRIDSARLHGWVAALQRAGWEGRLEEELDRAIADAQRLAATSDTPAGAPAGSSSSSTADPRTGPPPRP